VDGVRSTCTWASAGFRCALSSQAVRHSTVGLVRGAARHELGSRAARVRDCLGNRVFSRLSSCTLFKPVSRCWTEHDETVELAAGRSMLSYRFAIMQCACGSSTAASSCDVQRMCELATRELQRASAYETSLRMSAVVCLSCQRKPTQRRADLQSDSHPLLRRDRSRKRRLTPRASPCMFVLSRNSTFRAVCAKPHSSYRVRSTAW
jgi:hypothetical protein